MAQKKKKPNGQQFLSPEQYLKQKARSLEMGKCYVSEKLTECGEGAVVVTRLHKGGKISMAIFQLDIYCLGVTDSFYRLRMDEDTLQELVNRMDVFQECSYEEAHNWIYGAIAFAEEGGIEPDKSFALTQYMLEEDTDDIPLIEYEFGKDGKHLLVCNTVQEANRYLPTLRAHLGNDVEFMIEDGKYDVPDLDEETMMERLANFEDNPIFKTYGLQTEYTYQHPEYPETLQLTTPDWFYEELNKPDNSISLKDDLVNRILELPYELVRENLERIILYHIGQTCDGIPEDIEEDDFTGIIANSVILLGEVGNSDSSLEVVLELLRQSQDFIDCHFGDAGDDIVTPTLCLLGKHRLGRLMEFEKEDGLDTYCKSYVFSAVTQMGLCQPERRDEILKWYREVIRFAIEKLPEAQWFDCELAGFLVCELIDFQAKELLPDITDLFDTGLVSLGICGDYRSVCRDIVDPRCAGNTEDCILDVRERFADMRRKWGR